MSYILVNKHGDNIIESLTEDKNELKKSVKRIWEKNGFSNLEFLFWEKNKLNFSYVNEFTNEMIDTHMKFIELKGVNNQTCSRGL